MQTDKELALKIYKCFQHWTEINFIIQRVNEYFVIVDIISGKNVKSLGKMFCLDEKELEIQLNKVIENFSELINETFQEYYVHT